MDRNRREAERIRKKRQDAAYLAAERTRQRDRMRKRRKRPAYQKLEREKRWWHKKPRRMVKYG